MVEATPICSKHFECMDNVLRYNKIEKYINTHDFDNLLLRIIFEHDGKHDDYFTDRGRPINPTNKMLLLFNYLLNNQPVNYVDDCMEVEYKGYVFCTKEYNNKNWIYIENIEDSQLIFFKVIYD